MRAALSSFSMMPLLFERRYTAGSRRAGLLRPNPVCTRRAKTVSDAMRVHEEEEEEEVCLVSSRSKDEKKKSGR